MNNGSITAQTGGFAALVAPGVRNSGTISARLGTVALASGNAFTLDFYGDNLITLGLKDSIASQVIDVSTGQPLKSLVSNQGVLKANGGRVRDDGRRGACGRRFRYQQLRGDRGQLGRQTQRLDRARCADGSEQTGRRARAEGCCFRHGIGVRQAKGTSGGTVVVTGEDVQLANANINASGRNGGGAVLIGGDWGGGSPNKSLVSNPGAYLENFAVPNATTTFVDAGTVINASAVNAGNGGKVIVWSNEATTFYGVIQAQAGQRYGSGGFVETSGHELTFNGSVNTGAPHGKNGTLLLICWMRR